MPERETPERLERTIPEALAGVRFDRALAELFPDYSRSQLQGWIRSGRARLDGVTVRPRIAVRAGQRAEVEPEAGDAQASPEPQALDLNVTHADADLVVVDKPPGLVVHPGAGNPDGTLENALLHHFPEVSEVPRHGIIHRLDKDTSGLLLVARSSRAHLRLTETLQARGIDRHYLALVTGRMPAGGSVDEPIARHPVDRTRMAVRQGGRHAVTHYRVRERFARHSLLDVKLDTGRTHQIRVHMAHIRYPIVGDPVYGRRPVLPAGASPDLRKALQGLGRQALHAARLALAHPVSGETLEFEAPMPTDMAELVSALRAHAREQEQAT